MLKSTHNIPSGPAALDLVVGDGRQAHWSATKVIERDTPLTRPLADPAYVGRAFIEAGAMAWPNGLELASWALHEDLREAAASVKAMAA